jgi:adenylate kinase
MPPGREEIFVIVLLFGAPGCGKGTQAAFIARRFSIPAISTGEIFRAECKAGTPLGKQVDAIVAQGGLAGDEVVNQMVANRISKPDCSAGFVLDGYPRTLPQAEFLDGLLHRKDLPKPIVIHLEVPAKVVVRRMSARRQCPRCSRIYNLLWQPPKVSGVCDDDGAALLRRPDDSEAVAHARLAAYEELTGPVIAHYRRRHYHLVKGERSPEEIRREVEHLLKCIPQWPRPSFAMNSSVRSDGLRRPEFPVA